ncbi:LysR family transcriptional regulator [Pseudomonas cannabina]|uniref:Regulatory protein, LysR:LysR, substrate-binding n=1 Tax=Pseudomonas cannabina TaxID=86840 RepID=A0A0P9NNC8_PSECA|nr:LysR family transcriptional regulator [Pseudomonas cannabina]KAA8698758.1 LysR family transcriptional regulator [Pseudomonas cannabina]KPW72763.1 Regulatory protein, LysR:LysR, substrate-binding [Pseudomonas cannabina]RMN32126.1 Regulatory protein, LysR:LysR, substrate-binding [Pseudomonas cannabina]SDR23188.1 DNA-binding transcriptional regulator, LysR family [Pseudomonas cannabina]
MHNTLRRLDLNLLMTLDALLAEQNVTRAARLLNLAQPTVSLQLGRLRELLDDPLLLPGPRGMSPTERARELRGPLREALAALEGALSPVATFEPALSEQTWRVAASDYATTALVWPSLALLRRLAPKTRLALLNKHPVGLANDLENGQLDLALHTRDEAPPKLRQRSLLHERYVLAGRRGHPALATKLSLKAFCGLEHAVMSPNGGGFVGSTDQALAAKGLERRVVLSVSNFNSLISALAHSDLVAVVPERLVRDEPTLHVQAPPLVIPGFEMLMLWPERLHRDPAHRWLRELIASTLETASHAEI